MLTPTKWYVNLGAMRYYEKGSFGIIPNINRLGELSKEGICVYTASLCKRADKNGRCFPSYKTIAKDSSVKSDTTISKALQELKEKGFISFISGKDTRRVNYYQILLTTPGDGEDSPGDGVGLLQEMESNYTHITIPIEPEREKKEKPFKLKDKIEQYIKDESNATRTIGYYLKWKYQMNAEKLEYTIQNQKQLSTLYSRFIRDAETIVENGYTLDQLKYARDSVSNYMGDSWTLSTLVKELTK